MLSATQGLKSEFLSACDGIVGAQLTVTTPEGETYRFGNSGPEADMQVKDWAAISAMAAKGDVGMGESYIAGLWETSSIERLTSVALRNLEGMSKFAYPGFWNTLKLRLLHGVIHANSRSGSSRNIRAHYDVGNEFYQLWLDPSMTYSSALFDRPNMSLEEGQARKNQRVLEHLSPGKSILEIGCGWGGFAEAATEHGHHVTGITLSPSQKGYADARLDGRADIELRDYRDQGGKFDNIVSIEMIEAVGESYWPSYFKTLKDRLAPGGTAMIQAITVPDAYFPTYRKTSDFIRQRAFPGGMLLCDQVIADQARHAGLKVRESFAFGKDYARTCREWSERMQAVRPKIMRLGYDDAFLRSWQFYLEICAAAFEVKQTDVVQVELIHA